MLFETLALLQEAGDAVCWRSRAWFFYCVDIIPLKCSPSNRPLLTPQLVGQRNSLFAASYFVFYSWIREPPKMTPVGSTTVAAELLCKLGDLDRLTYFACSCSKYPVTAASS